MKRTHNPEMADAEENFGLQNQSNQRLLECENKAVDFCWEDYQQTTGNYGMISGTILATFIVIANCLLFFGIIFSKNNMMSQRFYQWVLSLSVLDIMFGMTLLIITVIAHPEEDGDSGRFFKEKQQYKMALFWIIFNASASFYNFVGLNIERMSAVRWPKNYNDKVCFYFLFQTVIEMQVKIQFCHHFKCR